MSSSCVIQFVSIAKSMQCVVQQDNFTEMLKKNKEKLIKAFHGMIQRELIIFKTSSFQWHRSMGLTRQVKSMGLKSP